jgi:hypothetical protein
MSGTFNKSLAIFKIFGDKALDYIQYYTIGNENEKKNDNLNNENNEDKLDDYTKVINIEKCEDEQSNKRIFGRTGFWEQYSWFFSPPTQITDGTNDTSKIFLGSAYNACCFDELRNNGIRYIVNVTKEIRDYYPDDFTYCHYNIYDNNKESIGEYLEKAYQDIKRFERNNDGNILIHCYMGASRSATVVLYYLIKERKNEDGSYITHDEALTFLKSKRKIVNPTFRFTKDLGKSMMISRNIIDKMDNEDKKEEYLFESFVSMNKDENNDMFEDDVDMNDEL